MSGPNHILLENAQLPAPGPSPDTDVVIFDGHCRFCTRQVMRLARWDGRERLSFLSLHAPEVSQRYPDLDHDAMLEQMYVVDRSGRRHGGAAAFRYLSRRLPALWPLAPLMHLPFSLPLWQWLYRQVARRRYLLGGTSPCEDDACEVHFGGKQGAGRRE